MHWRADSAAVTEQREKYCAQIRSACRERPQTPEMVMLEAAERYLPARPSIAGRSWIVSATLALWERRAETMQAGPAADRTEVDKAIKRSARADNNSGF